MEYILIVFIALVLVLRVIRPKRKHFGEKIVARELNKLLDDEHFVLNDVLLIVDKGYSQIDHIVVSVYGIFVIETKEYSGWIYGNEESEYWKQKIFYRNYQFRNPIKQNWSHIFALKEVLWDFSNIEYHPIIVFAGSAELKYIKSNIPVICINGITTTIRNIEKTRMLTIRQVHQIVDELQQLRLTDKESRLKHIENIQLNLEERENKANQLICPKCGEKLILRDGKYGKFYGCSSYPQCKFTLNY
jgi:hypothetical protein